MGTLLDIDRCMTLLRDQAQRQGYPAPVLTEEEDPAVRMLARKEYEKWRQEPKGSERHHPLLWLITYERRRSDAVERAFLELVNQSGGVP